MPYIKPELRAEKDKVINAMLEAHVNCTGDLNYILFKFCKYYITPGYNNYKNYIGELEETIAEIRRKILAPYEEKKEKDNGGI
jgi:hypothetical protein